ncbi:transmembrane 53-b [Fusarium sporotrichioides]|uniref:Transmembrane 53-b n=1 Tax=Fusarium sporotrichioides TaxID=5514 RepID=A0A395S9Q2_FUSSP|nr:transmembrane 53-b [Fusarium sporotrichioides]
MSTDTAHSAKTKPLSYMEKLSDEVFFYRPSTTSDSAPNGSIPPKLVIVASWTNALDTHIAKYVDKHKQLFPAAQILLVKSFNKTFFDPKGLARFVRPMVPVIRAAVPEGASSTSEPSILIHIFSNGGSSCISALYDEYSISAQADEDPYLPPHVMVFDSAPGAQRASTTHAFFVVNFSKLQRFFLSPLIYIFALFWQLTRNLGNTKDWLVYWGKTHNEAEGKKERELRRSYIYSDTDDLVLHTDLEIQASQAVELGYNVRMEKFVGSQHVAHARHDDERYWRTVQRTWDGF